MTTSSLANILVVEDKNDWRELLSELLKEAGYNVAEARTYKEAMSKLFREKFDLVSIDWSLNDSGEDRDGMLLLEDVIERDIPAVIVSGIITNAEARHAIRDLGAFFVFEKANFSDTEQYLEIVKQAITEKRNPLTSEKKAEIKQKIGVYFRGEKFE